MSSMNFDTATISVLMTMVDEHKDDIKEGDYIKVCNAMKFLYNHSLDSRPKPVLITNHSACVSMRSSINTIQSMIASNGRLTVYDKLSVLSALFSQNGLSMDGLAPGPCTQQVHQMELILGSIVSTHDLKVHYQQAKERRLEEKRRTLRERINNYERCIARLSALPPFDEYQLIN